jgi:hypothetical protein
MDTYLIIRPRVSSQVTENNADVFHQEYHIYLCGIRLSCGLTCNSLHENRLSHLPIHFFSEKHSCTSFFTKLGVADISPSC